MKKLTDAESFFYSNAGFSWMPGSETKEGGRIRCAKRLAHCERLVHGGGYSFRWEIDPDMDSRDWKAKGAPVTPCWVCAAFSPEGHVCASLGGIDLGHNTPWQDSYRRVVEAQLAEEICEENGL